MAKVNIQQLKSQLDLALKLQEEKNHQATIQKTLLTIQTQLKQIQQPNHSTNNNEYEASKNLIYSNNSSSLVEKSTNQISNNSYIISLNTLKKYNFESNFIENYILFVNFFYEKQQNNKGLLLKEDKKGKFKILKINDLYLLFPIKNLALGACNRKLLSILFELKEYNLNQCKAILEEPAVVSYTGAYFQLEKKGMINFGNK